MVHPNGSRRISQALQLGVKRFVNARKLESPATGNFRVVGRSTKDLTNTHRAERLVEILRETSPSPASAASVSVSYTLPRNFQPPQSSWSFTA